MDGKVYDITKGMWDKVERRFVFPGELINCFSGDMIFRSESPLSRLWRAPFNGPMIDIQIGADLLSGTPNHPILTRRGWMPLGLLNDSDEVVCMSAQSRSMIYNDEHERISSFADVFESLAIRFGHVRRDGARFHFYGDRADGDVDEIIVADNDLASYKQTSREQNFGKDRFAEANLMIGQIEIGSLAHVGPALRSGGASHRLSISDISGDICRRTAAWSNPVSQEHLTDIAGSMPRRIEIGSDGGRAHSRIVELNDLSGERIPIAPTTRFASDQSQLFAQIVRVAANGCSHIFEFGTTLYEFRRVRYNRIRYCSGHIFTAETESGFYSVSGAYVQAKNCRCTSRPIVPGFT
jgi:hypothetical protein